MFPHISSESGCKAQAALRQTLPFHHKEFIKGHANLRCGCQIRIRLVCCGVQVSETLTFIITAKCDKGRCEKDSHQIDYISVEGVWKTNGHFLKQRDRSCWGQLRFASAWHIARVCIHSITCVSWSFVVFSFSSFMVLPSSWCIFDEVKCDKTFFFLKATELQSCEVLGLLENQWNHRIWWIIGTVTNRYLY